MDKKKDQEGRIITDRLLNRASELLIPLSGTFELSPICNFSCKMCYVRKTRSEVENHHRPAVTKEEWLRIARQAKEAGMVYLLLTGGEPLLWPDFWELYRELTGMGFLISINTNGSLIDDEVIERFSQNMPNRVNVTLYGASDETYEQLCGRDHVFQKVTEGIKKMQEAGIEVKVNCSLTPHNAGDLQKIVEYTKENDLLLSVNTYMFPPVRRDIKYAGDNDRFTPEEAARYYLEYYRLQYGEEMYQNYLHSIRQGTVPPPGLDEDCIDSQEGRIRCRAGNASFWITWDGYLTPCGMMPHPKVELRDREFKEAWQELTEISQQTALSGICHKCPDQKLCHSCAAMAIAETGNAEGIPKYLCEMVNAYQKYANELIEKTKGGSKL